MSKAVLITGGAGYVGSSLVPLLLSQGYHTIVMDNLLYGGESLLGVWRHPNFKFVCGDITSPQAIEALFTNHQIDAVVHLAAIVGDPACAKQSELARRVNLDASLQLLSFTKRSGAGRFIFASTCSNYGKMANPNSFINEQSTLAPVSLYAELKVQVEQIILQRNGEKNGFCPTVLRFATVYGISPRMRFDLTVNEFTKDLALGRPLEVFGEQFWRPYCHVLDIAHAVFLILQSEKEKIAYQTFNVGDNRENYQKQMIIEEIKKFIPNAQVQYVHKDEDPRDYRVSFEKIKQTLGFEISKTVPDGISEVYECVKQGFFKNPDDGWYKN